MNKVMVYCKEVVAELRKVTWPSEDELIGSTIIVLLFVAFMAVLLGVIDLGFQVLMSKLLGNG